MFSKVILIIFVVSSRNSWLQIHSNRTYTIWILLNIYSLGMYARAMLVFARARRLRGDVLLQGVQ